jgi:hypothetical protein
MKTAWVILIISALTDGGLAAISGVLTVLTSQQAVAWTWTMTAVPVLMGLAVAFRTIQQGLKASPDQTAKLMGVPVTTVTQTPTETIKSTPTGTVVARRHSAKPKAI